MNWPVKCSQCGEEFDSMDSYGDSNAMLRAHQELKHGTPHPDIIMCVWNSERKRALELGWASENILGVTSVHLEGRLYSSIHLTWGALDVMGAPSPILERISRDQIRMGVKTTLGPVVPPPALLHGKRVNH